MDPRPALRNRLRTARTDSGASPAQVADALGWSLVDFLAVEAVAGPIDDGRLSALLDHYGLLDHAIPVAGLGEDLLSREVRLLATYEAEASSIRSFEPALVPGLLQTRQYAEVALGLFAARDAVGPLVEARLARQALLDRDDRPPMRFLIDESALHRWAGATGDGPEIMRAQLDRLRLLARHPRIDIRIVPYSAGLHDGLKGPFVVLERPELLYLEGEKGDVVRTGPDEVHIHRERFDTLSGLAVPLLTAWA
ncbi:DUF5753 domain-containing protein [Actinoplanes sp. TRM 88003]|uniref:DUF5753 domain-containing protein n=1 Tax=Paractinoplanes aksuensis TaxID=2939490 RepID=A0ABT1DWM3_9ACTN|nr:DUF5753 domain-containing protein [Actinoplanes aksuensis]MCO8274948.1 DUF5753 domain-containing protein [Actinoplanes aksuensis]